MTIYSFNKLQVRVILPVHSTLMGGKNPANIGVENKVFPSHQLPHFLFAILNFFLSNSISPGFNFLICKTKNSCDQAFARKHYICKKAESISIIMILRLKMLSHNKVA